MAKIDLVVIILLGKMLTLVSKNLKGGTKLTDDFHLVPFHLGFQHHAKYVTNRKQE